MDQEALRRAWLDAPANRLCAWEVAKALGLREASKDIHSGNVNLPWIAARVAKVDGGNPSRSALHQLFDKIDADPEWFPGKHTGTKRGPKPLLTKAKRRCIAASAMAKKAIDGDEPVVDAVILACPAATMNPVTGKPFCAKSIRKVFLEDCYDFDAEHPWKFQSPLQKVFLTDDLKVCEGPLPAIICASTVASAAVSQPSSLLLPRLLLPSPPRPLPRPVPRPLPRSLHSAPLPRPGRFFSPTPPFFRS